ncbi:hypothetical protein VE02_09698 [Pseudogymnoascus sp. 03VT05]|nr:hypothetical protein VE02_09698 [Pseudogymnoascus sp. 03VT05]
MSAESSAPSDAMKLGIEMRRKVLGDALLSKMKPAGEPDIFTKTSSEFITEVCFASYARPGLELKQRSLLNIGILTALGRGPELKIHVQAALNVGLTEEEICEAIRHTMIYTGVPAGRDAFLIASAVIAELKANGELK